MIKLKFFNLFVKYAVISMLLHLYSLSSIAQYSLWDNHLCTTYISGIEQEGSDFWIATHGGGLLKLNPATGNTVYFNKHNSSIPSVLLTVIAIDSLGNKWIGSEYDGLLCFDVNNNWTCYNTLNSPLPSNEIKSICIKGGILWIGTKSGLARFDGINWTIFTSTIFGGINYWINDVRDIAIDSIGNIWICSFKTGLMKYDGTSWIVYNCNNIPQLSFNTQIEVSSVGIDKSGNIWAGILEKLFKFNGSTWAWGGGPGSLITRTVTDIKTDHLGNVWVIQADNTLVMYNGNQWYNASSWPSFVVGITPGFSLPGYYLSDINNLFIDDSNHVWVGLFIGLARYSGIWTDFSPSIQSELTANGIGSLNYVPSTQTFYIGECLNPQASNNKDPMYGSGLTIYDGNNWVQKNILCTCPYFPNFADCLSSNNTDLWIGNAGGIVHWDGTNITPILLFPWCEQTTTALVKDNNSNNIYIGTNTRGIYKYDGTNLSVLVAPSNITSTFLFDISSLALKDNFLLAGSKIGLYYIDTITGTTFIYNTSNSGLPSNSINDIIVGKPMWLATDNGLVSTDLSTWTIYNITNSGIPTNFISCITKDSYNNIWIGTKGFGVARFDGTNFTNYNTSNSGLTDDYIIEIVADNENNIWFGTREGGISVYKYGVWLSGNQTSQNAAESGLLSKLIISPNPFHSTATLNITLQQPGNASLFIFNPMGQKIKTLFANKSCPKQFTVNWDGSNDAGMQVLPGVYFCSLKSAEVQVTQRIVLIK